MKRVVDFRCEDFLRKALAESKHASTVVRAQPPHARSPEVPDAAACCRVLIVAEVQNGRLDLATARTVSCGRRVCEDVEVAVFAGAGEMLAGVAARLEGVRRVLQEEPAADADAFARQVADLIRARGSTHVFVPGSPFGERLIVRLAEQFGLHPVFGVMGVVTPTTFARARSRATVVTVETLERPVLATVRLGAFHAARLPRHRRPRKGTS
jgi:electron transfer flavoprotein alpha subunit